MWHVKPKHHYAQHVGRQCELINPRRVQNYLDEGIVGVACGIYASSSNGPVGPARLQYTALVKLRVGRHLRRLGVGGRVS